MNKLIKYKKEAKLKREFNTRFKFWEEVVHKKARKQATKETEKKIKKRMEVFYGNVLCCIENAEIEDSSTINSITKGVKIPKLFSKTEDNEEFKKIIFE